MLKVYVKCRFNIKARILVFILKIPCSGEKHRHQSNLILKSNAQTMLPDYAPPLTRWWG